MSQVVIQCPATRKDIPTGIDLDEAAWESTAFDQSATQCLWCGQLHVWSKQDARLEVLTGSDEEAEQAEGAELVELPTEKAEQTPKPAKQEKKQAEKADEQPERVEQLSMQA